MAHKITKPLILGVFLLAAAKISAAKPDAVEIAPNQPRDLASFTALFAKSPFAMSTVSNQSPISQRYVITGAMTIDDISNVFLLDKTTQDRLMISANHPDGGVTLISLQKDSDASMVRATIRVGSDTGVVAFEQAPAAAANAQAGPTPLTAATAQPVPVADVAKPVATASAVPASEAGTGDLPAPPPRRTIHRPAPALPSEIPQSPPTS